MTNKEAIEVLSTYDMSEDNDDAEFKDAVAVAIKALEQEDVLDKITAEINAHKEELKTMADTDDWYAGKLRGHECDIEIIDKCRQGGRDDMTDIELVIKILEDVYTRLFDNGIQDNEIAVDDVCEMARALRLGTPIEQEPINEIVQKAYEDGKKDGYVQAKIEQEPKYCERSICLRNEYNGISCNECEVTKMESEGKE